MRIILLLLLCISCCPQGEALHTDKTMIVKVGGCDKNGSCGVLYDDGSTGRQYYPVEGEYSSTQTCRP